ncbi:ribonuclease H-like domain-containing protein [Tanacetum coccineum]
MFLCQKKHATEIHDHVSMRNCHSFRTSFDKETILWAYGTPICDLTLYMSLAGDLQYLTFTRLDMSYRVQQVALLLVVLLSAIMFFLATTYWSCKRQYTLSRSSAEGEYCGLINAAT